MVSRAARINPEYEGKGLYRLLDENLTVWAKSQHVTIKAQTTTERNKVITKPSFQEKNKLMVSKVCIPIRVTLNSGVIDKPRSSKWYPAFLSI